MRLLLVRHGESLWNLERRLQGQTMDVPLTERGLAQATETAERVKGLVSDELEAGRVALVCSDQLRAVQTAEVIGRTLGLIPQPTELAREQAFGNLEGRCIDELEAQPTPEGFDISEVRWGGGESVQMVHERCGRLLAVLREVAAKQAEREDRPAADPVEASGGTIVLVSHGDLIRVLLAVLEGRSHRDVEWRSIGNAEVIVREVIDGTLPDESQQASQHGGPLTNGR